MISLNCTICQIPCPTIVTGSPTIILSVNRMVVKISRCDCCDHVPHPIVTPIYRDVTTLCLVYTTQIPLSPACCTAQWQVTKEWKNTNENKNVSPLNKLYLPWTTSDCNTSTTHFIAHPMACLAGMISIFHLHNALNYPNTNVNKI